MKKNERLTALKILMRLQKNNTSLSVGLANKDVTPLVHKLCYGVCRSYFQLETIAHKMVKKKPKSDDVWLCLLMGIYQIHDLRMPEYAVVKETVSLLDAIKKSWAKGLLNAVLRGFCRQKNEILKEASQNQTFQFNHPKWMINKYIQQYPQKWKNILQANDQHPPMTIRVNLQKTTREDYLKELECLNILGQPTQHSNAGIILDTPVAVEELPGFFDGQVSVQDEAAQLAASMLDLKPNIRVLDACCAPGGKTGHILETETNLKTCVAVDIEPQRILKVKDNLNRLNLSATVKTCDAASPETWWDGVPFDRILLDAPCSATGVVRRHPDIKLLRSPKDIQQITLVQNQLLRSLWPLLAPGGKLLYATCSVMKEENEQQIQQFLSDTSEASFEDHTVTFGHSTGFGRQILPGDDNMDGFFYSLLVKNKSIEHALN